LGLTASAASQLVERLRLTETLYNVDPRLAKPRLGLNYVRCFAAR
jgi:hypothetical protein